MRGGEQEWAGAVIEEIDNVACGANVAAENADGFGKCAHLDIHAAVQVEVVHSAAAVASQHAGGVRIVNHHDAAVLLGELHQLRQGSDIAFHGEDAVSD